MLMPIKINEKFIHLGGAALSVAGMKGKLPKFGEILNCD
jgi:hypothetical protein